MNKITTAALAGLVAVTATASASVSRWAGFGDASDYIADVQDIWTLPGVVASNKNATYFEFGKATNPSITGGGTGVSNDPNSTWGGVHSELGPGVLGVWVNRGQSSAINDLYNNFTSAFAQLGNLTTGTITSAGATAPGSLSLKDINSTDPAAGRVDILYGFSLNDNLDLGISLSRANLNAKKENVGNVSGSVDSYDANGLGFGLGVEMKELAFFKLLEVGFTADMDGSVVSAKTTAGEDKIENSASNYSLRVGGDIAGDEGKFGRLELGLGLGSASSKNGVTSASPATGDKEWKAGSSSWKLAYAMGKSGEKGMGLAGLALKGTGGSTESDAANSKSDNSSLTLQLTTAGEAKVKEWLTARAGIAANLYQSSSKTNAGATNPVKTSSSNNGGATLSTGLSMNFGDLTIDGALNQDVLYTGTYLISGVAESLFGQVSATWGW